MNLICAQFENQRESTMAMEALKKMTGNKKLVMLAVFHYPLFERTGGGRIWVRAMTRTRAAVWVSAAISAA